MYRLSQIRDERLEKIISKELQNGFDNIFHFSSNDEEAIRLAALHFCEYIDYDTDDEFSFSLLLYKITAMYQELSDQDHEYTFDELGEWLLFRMLTYTMAQFELYLEDAEYDSEAELDADEPDIEDFWESSLSEEDIHYVKTYVDQYYKEFIDEIADEEEGLSKAELYEEYSQEKELFINRIIFFPFMSLEVLEDLSPEFLFWDRDFLMVEQFGPHIFDQIRDQMPELTESLGLSSANKYMQLLSGSEKFDLE